MVHKLKSTIVIKTVNSDVVFVLDLADSEDRYYKFEGVSCAFIKMLETQTPQDKIIAEVLSTFEGCDEAQITKDFTHFIGKLQSLNFLT